MNIQQETPSLQNLFYQTLILEIYFLCSSPKAAELKNQLEILIQEYQLSQYPQCAGLVDFTRVVKQYT